MRRACRKDAVHDLLVSAHRQLGWFVAETYQLAQAIPGFPDALAVHPVSGVVVLLEFKGLKGKLTADERQFHVLYPGLIEVERTITDVMANHRKYMVADAG